MAFSLEFQADPFPVYQWMLEEAPVFHSEKRGWWAFPAGTTHANILS